MHPIENLEMNKSSYIIIYLLGIYTTVFAQKSDSLKINIQFNFADSKIELNEKYVSKKNDTLTIESIKFYLSNIVLNYKDNSSFKEANSYHLVDIEKSESQTFSIKNDAKKEIESLTFSIGIDSTASVSGALSGDLDPSNGMYWAWQSGYINMKIEGKSSSCITRKNAFHFHVGGYLEPYYAIRTIEINFNDNNNFNDKNQISLVIDLAKLFNEIKLSETNSIMIPGKEAMKIADLSTKIFTVE